MQNTSTSISTDFRRQKTITSKTPLTLYGRGFCASDRTPTTTGSPAGPQSNQNVWVLPPISRNVCFSTRTRVVGMVREMSALKHRDLMEFEIVKQAEYVVSEYNSSEGEFSRFVGQPKGSKRLQVHSVETFLREDGSIRASRRLQLSGSKVCSRVETGLGQTQPTNALAQTFLIHFRRWNRRQNFSFRSSTLSKIALTSC